MRRGPVLPFLLLMPFAASCGRPSSPGAAAARARLEAMPAARQFADLGCVLCHGPEAPHHLSLKQSQNRPVADVVTWILDAQAVKPGTAMPSYKDMIDEAQARPLAEWVQEYARTIK